MTISVPTVHGPLEIYRTSDLTTRGITTWMLRDRILTGEWGRIQPGYYVSAPPRELSHEQWHALGTHASADAYHEDWAVSHHSAALAWGIALYRLLPAPIHLSRDAAATRSVARPHTKLLWTPLPESSVTSIGPLRTTTPCRTLLDLCRSVPHTAAVVAIDSALHLGLASTDLLTATFEAPSRLPRITDARLALRAARPGAESPFETVSRLFFAAHGIPEPVLQHVIRDNGRFVARGDFFWPEAMLIGEADGQSKYRDSRGQVSQERFDQEKDREAAIRDLGYDVIRWRPADLRAPEQLAERILRRIASRTGGARYIG